MGFGAALIFAFAFFGVWFLKDAVQGNSIVNAACGAAFILIAWLLGHGTWIH